MPSEIVMPSVFAGSVLLSGISNQNVALAGTGAGCSRPTIFSRGIYAAHKVISPNTMSYNALLSLYAILELVKRINFTQSLNSEQSKKPKPLISGRKKN